MARDYYCRGVGGQFLFAPLSQELISGYGWSQAIVIVSVIIAITIPLSLSLRSGAAESLNNQTPQSLSHALAEASGHRGYWLLVVGFLLPML